MGQIHIIDGQKDMILDFIAAKHIIDDTHKKSLEDRLETYNFITFTDRRFSAELEKRNRIIIPDEDGGLVEFVIFEVAKYKDTEGHKAQVFTHASYLELKKASILKPERYEGRTASQHAGFALNKTGWRVGNIESTGTRTLSINEHTNPYEFLKRIAKEFELELRFRVEHDNNKITGRYVDLLERVGMWRGREVEFGKDLEGIKRIEKQDIVTALLGLGPEKDDGSRIEVLVEDFNALERWGWIDEQGNLNHLIEPYEIQSDRTEMTETQARQYTRTALNKRINTQVTYECTIVDLENVPGLENKKIRFGDTIKIKDTSFNPPLYLEARVFEQERSIKTTAKKDIKLGDFIEYTEEQVHAIWKQLQKQIQNRVSYYEMVEHTYDRLTIDGKDEKVFEDGKTFAEATGNTAEKNAKEYAVEQDALIKVDVESYADKVSEQKAKSALDQAKLYAVAQEVYDIQMRSIANDISERAPIEYVDGQLRAIEIGGRNYISGFNSDNWESFSSNANLQVIADNKARIYGDSPSSHSRIYTVFEVEADTQYTLSSNIVVAEGSYYLFREKDNVAPDRSGWINIQSGEDGSNNYSASVGKKKYTFTTTNETKSIIIEIGSNGSDDSYDLTIENLKLEKGNKATDWSPAPEDIFSEIEKKPDGSTVYTIEQIENRLNNYVGITKYTTDQKGIITDLDDYGTRIGQNEKAIGLKADDKKVDQVSNSLTEKIGEVEVKADGVVTSVRDVRADLTSLGNRTGNLVNNPTITGSHTGWTGGSVTSTMQDFEGVSTRVLRNTATTNSTTYSTWFDVDPGKAYEVSMWIRKSANRGRVYVGLHGGTGDSNTLGFIMINPGGTISNADTTNAYFWSENSAWTEWRKITGYIMPSGTNPNDMKNIATSRNMIMKPTIKRVRLRWLNYENGGTTTYMYVANPKVVEVSSESIGRITTLNGSITTLAGEVNLKASQDDLNSVEGRVSSAESKLDVLPGQINAKVSKNGAFGELNLSPDRALLDFDRVNITGKLEAKHIKSLAGLNINDQFVVNAQGKVTIGNNRVTIDDRSISITRPDGAVWMQDGMVQQDYGVTSYDPYDMDYVSLSGNLIDGVFRAARGFYRAGYQAISGGGDYNDIRDPNKGYTVKFTTYEFIHSARYFVIGYRKAINSTNPRHQTAVYDGSTRIYLEWHDPGGNPNYAPIILDLGKPTYKRMRYELRIGVNKGDVSGNNTVAFRVNRVFQTDFI